MRPPKLLMKEGDVGPLRFRLANLLCRSIGKDFQTSCTIPADELKNEEALFGGQGILVSVYSDLRTSELFVCTDEGLAWMVTTLDVQLGIDGWKYEPFQNMTPCYSCRQLTVAECEACGTFVCNDCAHALWEWPQSMFCQDCYRELCLDRLR